MINRLQLPRFVLISLILASSPIKAKQLHSDSKVIEPNETTPNQYESVNQVIKNPTLASGLTSGAQSLNKTVDTLMESIFYSIMDQTFDTKFTNDLDLSTSFERIVNETALGTYVVSDHFRIGPNFQKEINRILDIPIELGSDGLLSVQNIYHRSDAIRAYENYETPWWRLIVNNWFGALPLLSAILPPSFTSEELYDPLSYALTPSLVPNSIKSAKGIAVGSIRRYGISGGIKIAFDPITKAIKPLEKILENNDVKTNLPLSIFKTGEHLVSVLRKSEYVYWVMISDSRSIGQQIQSLAETGFYIFSKLIPIWTGAEVLIKPIDASLSQARVKSIQQLYTFDFRHEEAKQAFVKATNGDLTLAYKLARRDKLKSRINKNSGISFEFNKVTLANQQEIRTSSNFFVQQLRQDNQTTSSEIEIHAPDGNSNILEAEQVWQNLDWNVLVGAESISMKNKVEMKVQKGKGLSTGENNYIFDPYTKSPINMFSNLNISDRFVDTKELSKIMKILRYYLLLPLKEVPEIPLYSHSRQKQELDKHLLQNPMNNIYNITLSPTHLGRLSINAHIAFPSRYLKQMSTKSAFQVQTAMAKAFDMKSSVWFDKNFSSSFSWYLYTAGWAAYQPLKIFNINIPKADFIREVQRASESLKKLKDAITPMNYLEAYTKLFSSSYPLRLIRTLSLLGDHRKLPRMVQFSTKAKHKPLDNEEELKAKTIFQNLNHKLIQSKQIFPKSFTFKTIDKKLNSFVPENYIDNRIKPLLSQINITPIQSSKDNIEYFVGLVIETPYPKVNDIFVHIKLEQSGVINFGRFVLYDKALKLKLSSNQTKSSRRSTSFFLNGKNSPFDSPRANWILSLEGTFNLYLSFSDNSQSWSEPKLIRVRLSKEGVKIL